MEDVQLLQRMSQGCEHSFKVIYERYWEFTFSSAYKRLKDTDQSKDIVQEIFTHIWQKRETSQIENLPAYLHVAVRNRVFKLLAKQKSDHPYFNFVDSLPELYHQADSNVLAKEFFKAYENLINTLSPKKQLIFRLRYEEDLTTKDIAIQLGLSRKTVQNQLTRAIAYLRASLFFLLLFIFFIL